MVKILKLSTLISAFIFSLICFFRHSNSQLLNQVIARNLNFTFEENGKYSFTRNKINNLSSELIDQSIYAVNIASLTELDKNNKIIKKSSNLKFFFKNSEDSILFNQNTTKYTFTSDFSKIESNFSNPNAVMEINFHFFKNPGFIKFGETSVVVGSNKAYVTFKILNYQFCSAESKLKNCEIPLSPPDSKIQLYASGEFLEIEFNFDNDKKESFKILQDSNKDLIDFGEFCFYFTSEISLENITSKLESKDLKATSDKIIYRFPKFQNLVFSSFVDAYHGDKNRMDPERPSVENNFKINEKYNVRLTSKGGKLNFKYEDITNNVTKNLDLSIKSINEIDTNLKVLSQFNNINHNIPDMNLINFNTEIFSKDKYQNITINKTKLYIQRYPAPDTVILIEVLIFTEKGAIKLDGVRKINVKEGDIKLLFEIMNWPFCKYNSFESQQNCPLENRMFKEAKYLDVEIEFKGKNNPFLIPYSKDKYSFGDLAIILTGDMIVDDKLTQSTLYEYPRFNYNEDIITSFTYRFPVFSKKASLEIILDVTTPLGPQIFLIILIGVAALLVAGLLLYLCVTKKIKKTNTSLLGK